MYQVLFQPSGRSVMAEPGITVLEAEQMAGILQDSPCGGNGQCGKCRVMINGETVLACSTKVESDMVVFLPEHTSGVRILSEGMKAEYQVKPVKEGELLAAVDIGTTTIVCYLLDGETGEDLAVESALNPQCAYGADVISRIQAALADKGDQLTGLVRSSVEDLIQKVCRRAGKLPSQISVISIVANPCMQQLFMGISTKNLAVPPFDAYFVKVDVAEAAEYLPLCPYAKLLVVPDIAGYIGSDTVGCVLSARMYEQDELTLMVDIGTNGEIVLGNSKKMAACSTAAGPALEGARITCGMRGSLGAIDHVWLEDGCLRLSVIGEKEAEGICGSGLIDAAAVMLESGIINKRGRIQKNYEVMDGQRIYRLSEKVYLTQEDIREIQLAKGAIAAGIELLAQHLGYRVEQIDRVLLAGAFGSYLNPENACRIGMLPPVLRDRIQCVGNAAGIGCKIMACNRDEFLRTDWLTDSIESVELASMSGFQKMFGKQTAFNENC